MMIAGERTAEETLVSDLANGPWSGADLEAETIHAAIRNEILQNEALRSAITFALDNRAAFIPSVGNLGDGLIQLGTFDLFKEVGLIPRFKPLSPSSLDGQKLIVIGGGGGWVEGIWEQTARIIRPFLEAGGKLILLPSSIFGFEQYFAQYARQVTLFARERISFERLSAVPELKDRVHRCHDLAFALNPATLSQLRRMKGSGELSLFRSDAEGCQTNLPPSNVDIALTWNGDIWHSREVCLQAVMAVARTMSHFEHVRTDRLHMTALAAMLGRRVTMSQNSYFKNKAVFEASLCRFRNVALLEEKSLLSSGIVSDQDRAESSGQTVLANSEHIQNELIALARLRREWFEPELLRLQRTVKEHEQTNKDLYTQLQEQRQRALHYAADANAKRKNISTLQDEALNLNAKLSQLQQTQLKQIRKFEAAIQQKEKVISKLQRQADLYRSKFAAIEGSRWYKAWRIYLRSYSLPVAGSILRGVRKAVGSLIRAI